MESKYGEIRCDFFDEIEGKWVVDAWYTADDNEEGVVIAYIDGNTGAVEYLDADARYDTYAQEIIAEVLSEILN